MVSVDKLKRLKVELYLDDDEILGKYRQPILKWLDKTITLYRKYELANSVDSLCEKLKTYYVSGLDERIYSEANDIIIDLIDEDLKDDGFNLFQLNTFQKGYITSLVYNANLSKHNKDVVELALGMKILKPKDLQLRRNLEDLSLIEYDYLMEDPDDEED